ncbi:MAG: UMP kinase [Bacteroidales bacterium]|jgi:uridylate kinase|nr:UMP kinase [Bacteroidales bacterium]
MRYNRILLKLSGESLMGKASFGIDPERLNDYSEEIAAATRENIQMAIVIGGGNIFRGMQGSARGFDRQTGDYMGMLATVINSLALRSSLEEKGVKVKLMSGIYIEGLTEKANGMTAKQYLEDGYVVIFSGGTGNPYFTTDTASALRAVEISADAMFKGTRVDGVYTEDPEKNPEAIKYDHLTFHEAFVKELKIMDLTAFTLCEENKIPVIVFNMNIKGNLIKLLNGEKIGTRIE